MKTSTHNRGGASRHGPGKISDKKPSVDFLDDVDLSADLTRDSQDPVPGGQSVQEKKSRARPVLIVIAALVTSALLVNYFFSRGRNLSRYLNQVSPGMSYEDVRELIPSGLVLKERATVDGQHKVSIFTYLIEPDIRPVSFMCLGFRGLFPKEDRAYIYFDGDDKVVGVQAALEREGWAPSWGTSKWDSALKFGK